MSKGKRSPPNKQDHPFAKLAELKVTSNKQAISPRTFRQTATNMVTQPSSKQRQTNVQAQSRPSKTIAIEPEITTKSTGAALSEAEKMLFLRTIGAVQPVANPNKQQRLRQVQQTSKSPTQAQEDAQVVHMLQAIVDGAGAMEEAETSEEPYAEVIDGISASLLRQLSKGAIAIQAHLDLHGMRRVEAHEALVRFIVQARRQDQRCLLIITGRGKSSPDGVAILRQALPRWLTRAPLRPHVLAFCTAKPSDGGPGAFYVLLRRAGIKPFGTTLYPKP